jgi:DNA-binding NarL/FixJ family response regulator
MSLGVVAPAVPARVFLVDDHPIVRHGLALLVGGEPDLVVCGQAAEADAALQALDSARPDILVVDISLDGPDGLDLVKAVRARNVTVPILVLSMHHESLYAERALRAGANGYLMKQEATEHVLAAIRRVLRGEVSVSERAAARMLQQYVKGAGTRPALATRSDRELEVFRLIGAGRSTRDIADDLRLSVKTVETHQAHIKEKLSLRSARELVQHAIESHLQSAATGHPPSASQTPEERGS